MAGKGKECKLCKLYGIVTKEVIIELPDGEETVSVISSLSYEKVGSSANTSHEAVRERY